MVKIKVLDKIVANQIAAGEVVDRPASVAKELLENAIDAGATIIDIDIEEGGAKYLRVRDNGSGMSPEDAVLAIERHATSKLSTADDLQRLLTLGFRGEALPSIASVSKFSLITREQNAELATCVSVHGGELQEVASEAGNLGTVIVVEDLFFNVPARRKFLKSVNTESRYIGDLVVKLALSRPDIKFSLKNNSKTSVVSIGNGSLADCIKALFGKDVYDNLLPVDYENDGVRIDGFISTPNFTKNNRSVQFLFVNNRAVNSKIVYAAIDTAYQSKIAKGTHAFVLLNMSVDTKNVDINVHPQKQEIKFSDENFIFKNIFKSIINTLEYPLMNNSDQNPYLQKNICAELGASHNPTTSNTQYVIAPTSHQEYRENITMKTDFKMGEMNIWRDDMSSVSNKITEYGEIISVTNVGDNSDNSNIDDKYSTGFVTHQHDVAPQRIFEEDYFVIPEPIGQIFTKYILATLDKDFLLIDQHAAHERIIYDRLCNKSSTNISQELLIPEFIKLLRSEYEILSEYHEHFTRVGLRIELMSDNTVRVESMPNEIKTEQLSEFLGYMLDRLCQYAEPSLEDFNYEIAHSIACKSAIKTGAILSANSMQDLIKNLYSTNNPYTCPHGRPIIVKFNENDLDKLFKRG